MAAESTKATAEAEIRALLDNQARAIRAKDVDGSLPGHAAVLLLFDGVHPLQNARSEAATKRLAEWLASFRGPIGYERRDSPSRRAKTWLSATAQARDAIDAACDATADASANAPPGPSHKEGRDG